MLVRSHQGGGLLPSGGRAKKDRPEAVSSCREKLKLRLGVSY